MQLISVERQKRLHAHSRTYVVGYGKKTGHEYLTGYCLKSGKLLGRHTDSRPDAVSIPRKILRHLFDKKRRCVLHHNHPGGTSLSRADLFNLAKLPGTLVKYAHGHGGQWFAAETLRERRFEDMLNRADGAFLQCLLAVSGLQQRVPRGFRNHIFNLGLDKAKVIRYTFHLDNSDNLAYNAISQADIDELLRAVVTAVGLERSLK